MTRIRALSFLLMFVGACAGVPLKNTAEPDLSPYATVKVVSVDSERFLADNPIFREHGELSAAVLHITSALHSEVSGYYESIAAEIDGKILYVNLEVTAFEPESGKEIPENLPLDAALNLGAEEKAVAGRAGVGIVVNSVELVDASTGEVLYFFDALGEGQHASPPERYSQAAHSAAKDVIWRIERLSGRRFEPHRLPSHRAP